MPGITEEERVKLKENIKDAFLQIGSPLLTQQVVNYIKNRCPKNEQTNWHTVNTFLFKDFREVINPLNVGNKIVWQPDFKKLEKLDFEKEKKE